MIPAHYLTSAANEFNGLSQREIEIMQAGFKAGLHQANNEAQPKLSDLEIRIGKVADLVKRAGEALYSPSF